MLRKTVQLVEGLLIGKVRYKTATLREQSVGDLIDAEAEGGGEFAQSITLLSLQIERLVGENGEELEGPLERPVMRKLCYRDLQILATATEELAARGRDGADPGDAPGVRSPHRE